MSLVNCSNCGKKVSDKANSCPGCGQLLIDKKVAETLSIICEECGAELSIDAEECPQCGCPVQMKDKISDEPALQKVEIAAVNLSAKKSVKKSIIIISIVVAILMVVGIVGGSIFKENITADYLENLESVTEKMALGIAESEGAGDLIKSVWHDTIYKKWDSSTSKYTCSNGIGFNSDFNDSITALFTDKSFEVKIKTIKINQEIVSDLMKTLQNPPKEYEEAYDSIKELYDSYLDLTNLATNPTGNFQTYSTNFNDAVSETRNCYKAMQIYIE